MNVAANNDHSKRYRWRLPLAWTVLIVFDACLAVLVWGQEKPLPPDNAPSAVAVEVVQVEGPNDVDRQAVRFEAIDVFVDSGDLPLAAYQFELTSRTPGVEIVGIEGGDHAAFAEPPYYDPKAMNHNRVIIAAFHAGENVPSGRSRVARIHVQLQGPGLKEYATKLSVAASTAGEEIPAKASIEKAKA
ncbi:MAG: hypothetical protein KDA81_08055 [Planctomycetaceae bacterium]|nr:hypothetical protein [Planctomycetaceae bacterium]